LTVCVKCNGSILAEKDWGDDEVAVLHDRRRNTDTIPGTLPLFMCSTGCCRQIYWNSPNNRSSSMRSKAQADELLELIIRSRRGEEEEKQVREEGGSGGESLTPRHSEHSVASFRYRTKTLLSQTPMDSQKSGITKILSSPPPPVEFYRHSLNLSSPYVSCFEEDEDDDSQTRRPISTIRNEFYGLIDHIFFSKDHFRCTRYVTLQPTRNCYQLFFLHPSHGRLLLDSQAA
jgi:hypothetical protein